MLCWRSFYHSKELPSRFLRTRPDLWTCQSSIDSFASLWWPILEAKDLVKCSRSVIALALLAWARPRCRRRRRQNSGQPRLFSSCSWPQVLWKWSPGRHLLSKLFFSCVPLLPAFWIDAFLNWSSFKMLLLTSPRLHFDLVGVGLVFLVF